MSVPRIVVLGAGVSGLTTAYLLSKDAASSSSSSSSGPKYHITVVAKHMPGDYDIEYCSPWAGANYLPVGKKGSSHMHWERETWPALKELVEKHPEAGIHYQPTIVYNREKDQHSATGQWFSELVQKNPWYKDVVDDFQDIPPEELQPGIDNAQRFTSVCINTAIYLPWLVGQCRKNGVVFVRGTVNHILDAAQYHHHLQDDSNLDSRGSRKADLIINCTGLSARKLGGVMDSKLHPARGQIVIVRNDPGAMVSVSGTDDGEDEVVYVMTRASGGGTVIGGSYQKHNWDSNPDPNLAVRIMKRAVELCPALVPEGKGIEGLDIIRHGVGLRPLREGGPRVEREVVDGVPVVHNYGHGGFGYQASFGCASAAVKLAKEALEDQRMRKAKL